MKIPALILCFLASGSALAQQIDLSSGSVVETVKRLRPGEYVWTAETAPKGPTLLIVNVTSQRAVLYRNGIPIAASSVSTGRPGYSTPTGVSTILQKHVEHYSSTYDNAPMPYMQRLTWRGVALHAGKLPGYPASHGCIRLPLGFAKLLYGVTRTGMTVVISGEPAVPRLAVPPDIAHEGVVWQPERSPSGPISIIASIAEAVQSFFGTASRSGRRPFPSTGQSQEPGLTPSGQSTPLDSTGSRFRFHPRRQPISVSVAKSGKGSKQLSSSSDERLPPSSSLAPRSW